LRATEVARQGIAEPNAGGKTMKSRIFTLITGMTLFTTLAMPVRLAAQEQPQQA
jgi:hypothetical protein